MKKGRLEAFSDGVIAIIITIMVIAIYWNNHHHLLHVVQKVNGAVLWANMHLLFWLSLVPFVTGWMGENYFGKWPVALYGVVLFFAGNAYYILVRVLISHHGKESTIARAIGNDFKGKISVVVYIIGIIISFYSSSIAMILYSLVAIMWLIPDRRIEKVLNEKD